MFTYLDTSMLVKRYVNELGSDELEQRLLAEQPQLLVSDLARLELLSTLNRKMRMRQLPANAPTVLYAAFMDDVALGAITLKPVESSIVQQGLELMRELKLAIATLDALHLATAIRHKCTSMFTTDVQLGRAAQEAGLVVWGV